MFEAVGDLEDELLFGGKLVAGKNAGAVKAEENSGSALGKHAAVQIGADQEDGDFFGDAGRAAHDLWWQARGQRNGKRRTIWYQVRRRTGGGDVRGAAGLPDRSRGKLQAGPTNEKIGRTEVRPLQGKREYEVLFTVTRERRRPRQCCRWRRR